jgi:hypothetical protein
VSTGRVAISLYDVIYGVSRSSKTLSIPAVSKSARVCLDEVEDAYYVTGGGGGNASERNEGKKTMSSIVHSISTYSPHITSSLFHPTAFLRCGFTECIQHRGVERVAG